MSITNRTLSRRGLLVPHGPGGRRGPGGPVLRPVVRIPALARVQDRHARRLLGKAVRSGGVRYRQADRVRRRADRHGRRRGQHAPPLAGGPKAVFGSRQADRPGNRLDDDFQDARRALAAQSTGGAWLGQSVDICKALGLKVVLVPQFNAGELDLNRPAEIDHFVQVLKEAAPKAQREGVTFGLEELPQRPRQPADHRAHRLAGRQGLLRRRQFDRQAL